MMLEAWVMRQGQGRARYFTGGFAYSGLYTAGSCHGAEHISKKQCLEQCFSPHLVSHFISFHVALQQCISSLQACAQKPVIQTQSSKHPLNTFTSEYQAVSLSHKFVSIVLSLYLA